MQASVACHRICGLSSEAWLLCTCMRAAETTAALRQRSNCACNMAVPTRPLPGMSVASAAMESAEGGMARQPEALTSHLKPRMLHLQTIRCISLCAKCFFPGIVCAVLCLQLRYLLPTNTERHKQESRLLASLLGSLQSAPPSLRILHFVFPDGPTLA